MEISFHEASRFQEAAQPGEVGFRALGFRDGFRVQGFEIWRRVAKACAFGCAVWLWGFGL